MARRSRPTRLWPGSPLACLVRPRDTVQGQEDAGHGRRVQVRAIAAILTAPGSTFTVESRVFAGEGHIAYYPQLVPAAFAWVLPPPAVSRSRRTRPSRFNQRLLSDANAVSDGRTVTISVRQSKLYALLTGSPEGEFQAETPLKFFTTAMPGFDITLTFDAPANGPASALVFSVNGVETRAVRRSP